MTMTHEQAVEAVLAAEKADKGQDARQFLSEEADRVATLSFEAAGLYFDFAKQDISKHSLGALVELARVVDLPGAFDRLSNGEIVNQTEERAAQHIALRQAGNDGVARAAAAAELEKVYAFAEGIRSGEVRTPGGKTFTHILHIGIGGSDLGPRLIYDALSGLGGGPEVRFLSSVDPTAFQRAVLDLNPSTTLVFVVSKSFSTPETSLNLNAAMGWLNEALGEAASGHLAAATSRPELAAQKGIAADRVFEMWDWVGGRYSLWSSVSLSVVAAIGKDAFQALLDGAREMDNHALSAPIGKNSPMLAALVQFWHRRIKCRSSWAVVPYARDLRLLPAWMQQLSMESLGKSVDETGRAIDDAAGPVVWGGEGPDGQHAYFQLLHQGRESIPVDLIAFTSGGQPDHRAALMSNAIAQAEALLTGRSAAQARAELADRGMPDDKADTLAPHMEMQGGRGSTFILVDRLDARSLGALLAHYEHQTYALAKLFGINAFDQFGVELGKQLAARIEDELTSDRTSAHDPSTTALLARTKRLIRGQGD